MRELVAATRNKDKAREIKSILKDIDIKILDLDDFENVPDIEEDGKTFEENASKKARIISGFTRRAAIADDSGLEVDALGGRPGVKSARFAGDEADYGKNNEKLLRLLKGVPPSGRKARFVCVIAIAKDGKVLDTVKGTCAGWIALGPKGANGFGYDPLFVSPEHGKTFAELASAVKNKISHRYRALSKAKESIKDLLTVL